MSPLIYRLNIFFNFFFINAGQGITLIDPDNVVITSGKLSLSQISIYQINNPKKGAWSLAVSGSNGGHEFFVKSSSATNVDFENYFLIAVPGRRGQKVEVPISNPVIGKLKMSWAYVINSPFFLEYRRFFTPLEFHSIAQ